MKTNIIDYEGYSKRHVLSEETLHDTGVRLEASPRKPLRQLS